MSDLRRCDLIRNRIGLSMHTSVILVYVKAVLVSNQRFARSVYLDSRVTINQDSLFREETLSKSESQIQCIYYHYLRMKYSYYYY